MVLLFHFSTAHILRFSAVILHFYSYLMFVIRFPIYFIKRIITFHMSFQTNTFWKSTFFSVIWKNFYNFLNPYSPKIKISLSKMMSSITISNSFFFHRLNIKHRLNISIGFVSSGDSFLITWLPSALVLTNISIGWSKP